MKHYDGPAFFRKKGISRAPREKKVTKQFKTPRFDDTQDKRAANILKRDSDHGDETPAFLKEIKNFKPQKRSKSDKRKQQIKTNYFLSQQRRQHHLYDELTRRLRITYDDLIVIADKQATIDEPKEQLKEPTKAKEPEDLPTSHPVQLTEMKQTPLPRSTNNHLSADHSASPHSASQRLSKHTRRSLNHRGLGNHLIPLLTRNRPVNLTFLCFILNIVIHLQHLIKRRFRRKKLLRLKQNQSRITPQL